MINVNQITAQLARMPDQALQQYAAMHKADPYILSLALAESNRRKEIRSASQMQAPQQPKVVDQAISGMGSGLPSLPADNLRGMEQSMAAGGIVAFDEGGEVPRYQSQGLVQYGGAYGGAPLLPSTTGYEGMGFGDFAQTLYVQALRKLGLEDKATPLTPAEARAAKAEANKMAVAQGRTYSPEAYGVTTPAPLSVMASRAGTAGNVTPAAAPTTVPGAAPDTTADQAPSSSGTGLRAGRGTMGFQPGVGLPGLTQTAAGTAQELQNLRGAFTDEIPYAQQQAIQAYTDEARKAKEAGLARLQADIAAQGPGMVEAERRAQAKEARLGKQEAEAGPMALINAGLMIMSGTSPYAAANIGTGGAAALKGYAENLDKLELARDKLDETFGKIENFRQNRDDMNRREIRAAEADIRNTYVDAKKLGLEALTKNTELNRQDVRTAFDVMSRNRASMYEVASRERLGMAQIAAQKNTPAMQEWNALLAQNKGDAVATAKAYREAQGEKFNPYEAYSKYLQAFAGKETLSPPMPFVSFLAQFGGATTTPPKNAQILR